MANTRDSHETLNKVYRQQAGIDGAESITYGDIVTAAQNWSDSEKDHFVSELSNAYMADIFTDSAYYDRYNDIFYENAAAFGAITRVIDVEIPDAIKSSAWEQFISGTSTIGSHTVYLPAVNEQLYINSTSWAVPLLISGNQYRSAFDSAAGMAEFDSYLRLSAQNSVSMHKADMNAANRNNYILTKIGLQTSQPTKRHVVNLVEEYCVETGTGAMTAQQFRNNADCLRFITRCFKKYKSLMLYNTVMFTSNPNSNGKFCPENRFVMQVLSDLEGLLISELYSNTYHDEFVKLPLYRDVPTWQALKDTAENLQFDTLSLVNGIPAGHTDSVIENGVVALMVDKYAIMHTNIQNRAASDSDPIRDVIYTEYQFTDKYMNNMNLNGIVFVIKDYTR